MHAFYDKVTDRARRSLELANSLARRKKHPLVTNLHILWGLLEEGQNIASDVLKQMGVNNKILRLQIETQLGYGEYNSHDAAVCYDKEACDCICHAITLGLNDQKVISCHHLLLALMSFQGRATKLLSNLNVEKELVEAYLGAVVKSVMT